MAIKYLYFFYVISLFTLALEDFKTVTNCRVTQVGSEYQGPHSRSLSGALCDMWNAVPQAQHFNDLSFPDGSKLLAKNDCRNPTRNSSGPWCYVQGVAQYCDIPFCEIEDCRITGPGLEYTGAMRQSVWLHDCLPWNKTEKNYCGNITDNSPVCNMCRNRDGSSSSPWCWVADQASENGSKRRKELCDIPLCTNADPVLIVNGETGTFNHFFSLNSKFFTAKFQLWDAKDWAEGRLAILLTVIDLSIGTAKLKEWGSGVAFVFGNRGAFLTTPEGQDRIQRPSILSGIRTTNVTINWNRNDEKQMTVSVVFNDEEEPAVVVELDTEGILLQNDDFKYFSFIGTAAIAELPPADTECAVVTTTGGRTGTWWLVERGPASNVFNFSVRLSKDATLILSPAPMAKSYVAVIFSNEGQIMIYVVEESQSRKITEGKMGKWSFWDWHGVKIDFWNDHLTVSTIEETGNRQIIYKSNFPEITGTTWIAPRSQSKAQWMFHCKQPATEATFQHEPPECVVSNSDLFYNGTHNTADGQQCIPWIDKRIPVKYRKESLYDEFGGKIVSMNYCRNLDLSKNGPFCFVHSTEFEVSKIFCRIPLCSQNACKLSGIGFDYTGGIMVTRSNRTCTARSENNGNNFCRNPSRNIGGPWCYTSDPNVPKDYCNVPDCQLPGRSIVLVSQAAGTQRMFYILPHWRKHGFHFWLKCWDPEMETRVIIILSSAKRDRHYKLHLSGGSAEKVQLFHVNGKKETQLMEMTSAHLVPSGFWRGLWLRIGPGIVQLGRERVNFAFIDWQAAASEQSLILDPAFVDFSTNGAGKWVGVGFKMDDCLVERVSGAGEHRLWPVDIRLETPVNRLKIFIYASGIYAVNLISDPKSDEYYSLVVEEGKKFTLIHGTSNKSKIIHSTIQDGSLLLSDGWTRMILSYSESFLAVEMSEVLVFDFYDFNRPFLMYWFSIIAKTGKLSWAANCEPLDIGEEPRNGGWGEWNPWECSVTCGGGEGRIERSCDSPRPNIMGKECVGSNTYHGACHDFPCGDVPPELRKNVRQRLTETALSLTASIGDDVKMNCNEDLAITIQNSVPNITFEWTLNGFPWISNRKTAGEFDLEISDVTADHNGVYVCSAAWEMDNMAMAVLSLIVTSSKPTSIVRETSFLELRCHGSALGHIYADLSQRWEIDGLTWKNYGPTFPDVVELETVTEITKYLQGEWTCIVSQENLGLMWKTNWLLLEVKPPPSFWTHLIEDKATAPVFGFVGEKYVKFYFFFLLTVLLLIFVAVLAACFYY